MNNINSKGFILLPRAILDTWLWNNPIQTQIWLEMVINASWKEKCVGINGKQIVLERGEFCMELNSISKRYSLDKRTLKRFINKLDSEHWLEKRIESGINIYKIVNYDLYQLLKQSRVETAVLGGVNSMHPQMHRNLHPQAHPNMHPLKENEENFINDCETEYCSINTVLLEDGNCTQNCTQNCTHDWQKNAPTNKINKINNNIFNNNNNNNNTNGRVCERAREEDFLDPNIDNTNFDDGNTDINHLYLVKQDLRWIKAVQKVFNFETADDVVRSLELFWSELIVKGIDSHESLTDFKSHYYGWMRIQQGLEEKKMILEEKKKNIEERNNRYNDLRLRKAAPISTEMPTSRDFKF